MRSLLCGGKLTPAAWSSEVGVAAIEGTIVEVFRGCSEAKSSHDSVNTPTAAAYVAVTARHPFRPDSQGVMTDEIFFDSVVPRLMSMSAHARSLPVGTQFALAMLLPTENGACARPKAKTHAPAAQAPRLAAAGKETSTAEMTRH